MLRRDFLSAAATAAVLASPAYAGMAGMAESELVLTGVTTGAVALAVAAGLWALAEQKVSAKLRRLLKGASARLRAAVGERDALIAASRDPLIVWGRENLAPTFYNGGEAILDSCLQGPDATELSTALDALSNQGTAFTMAVRDVSGRPLTVRGKAVGGLAAVWIESGSESHSLDFRGVLNALPLPVWLRDRALSLVWANDAYLSAAGAPDLETIQKNQTAIDKSERDLAATAKTHEEPMEAKRYAVIGGQRRALLITEIPTETGIVGTAADITEVAAGEAKLQQHIDAHTDTLDKLATAVAIFGPDQKLHFYNRAFVKLWDLPEKWLDKHPKDSEVLDRLRDERKLPEQRDYQGWKRERIALYETAREYPSEDLWHVPGGKTLRVVAQPHPFGGLTFLYEDVTEKLSLESSYNTLIKVQSATLNTLQEAVAVFGPDGRLKLYNAAFSRLWLLTAKDLADEPHVRQIAEQCSAKFGDAPVWDRVIQAIVAGTEPDRHMEDIERNDRTILQPSLSPLPDGATLVTFTDVTDRFRIEHVLRERAEALEAADRLKSEFIKHVSYELRTPLNTIVGFAELLSSQEFGPLNDRQAAYMKDIVSASNTLTSLVSDILDLALIESGALRLELEKIDLSQMLHDVASHAREWGGKVGLTLEVDCPEDEGIFLADARRVRQVVFNLLSNAFKFTPKGGVIVLGGRIQGENVQIYVRDNGPGIAPELRATVFERFSAKAAAGQRGGAGLGLALVNRFVELHDGWVEIDSSTKGTLVRCHFPRRIQDHSLPEREALPTPAE
ncbi:signal transduction histidine kinase [Rhizomicrobium palustre]|uniref:histidine kinase n=1 Tax=Rhizomicrobium palustre TaxID=189966 RepID=A0A846N624_9PROT|nr:PAS domain-containing sensor histidine kinase [Rhizomicrobium palustre]NIK90477.1 signal transduction histidine kinase [Rhizomicrobium palustre]